MSIFNSLEYNKYFFVSKEVFLSVADMFALQGFIAGDTSISVFSQESHPLL